MAEVWTICYHFVGTIQTQLMVVESEPYALTSLQSKIIFPTILHG
jgi:hypothetical protein